MPNTKHHICYFFLHHPAPTEIYTLSLHDALPIFGRCRVVAGGFRLRGETFQPVAFRIAQIGEHRLAVALVADRKSTRLNSSHSSISYAVFCLKKKTISHSHF